MKKVVFTFILLSVFFCSKTLAQDPPQLKEGFQLTRNFVDPYEQDSINYVARTSTVVTYHSYDALHYKLELDFYNSYLSPYTHKYHATETLTFRADSTIRAIQLNAIDSSIKVDSVKLAADSFLQKNDSLTLYLDSLYHPGDSVIVKIYYTHNPIVDKTFLARDGFVYTDCSPEKARNWFPCWDKPFDKATFEVIVCTKSGAELCSNGSLIDSFTKNDTLVYHWKSRDPMSTYIMASLSNLNYNFDKIYWKKPSNPNDSIPVLFYYNKNETISPLKDVMTDMANYFSSLFGEYPFEKIAWATLNGDFPWAGMENQTIISLYAGGWPDRNTTSHEFAHHWFGDLITHATWSDIFLKEGFPQYAVCLWFEHLYGKTGYLNKTLEFSNYYLQKNPGRAIYIPGWATTTPASGVLFDYAVTYCKSACVLYMLRNVVGDSVFFKILKSYATDPAFKFKTATVADFYNKVNTISGTDYSWFLDEWLKNPNHPVYNNTYTITQNGSAWKVDYTIRQTQTNAPFFKMPVELEVSFADNSDSILKIMNDNNNQPFSFTFNKEPKTVVFDPFIKIQPKEESGTTTCTGTKTLSDLTATIDDGSEAANYSSNLACYWSIMPSNDPKTIKIHFTNFDTEDSNDVLYIFDTKPYPSVQLAKLYGRSTPTDLILNTNRIRLKFNTNNSLSRQGWALEYTALNSIDDKNGNIQVLSVYPNPSKDNLKIGLQLSSADRVMIRLTNSLGQIVYESTAVVSQTAERNINVSGFSKGIYLLDVSTSQGRMQKKVIVE